MTRRSCAIYATGIVCAHLLIVGIALLVAQVFQTMIHSRLKQVSRVSLFIHLFVYLGPFNYLTTFPLRPTMTSVFHPQWLTIVRQLVAVVAPAGVCKLCFYLKSHVLAFDTCGFI